MYINMKTSPALLWGLIFLFAVKSSKANTPGTNSTSQPTTTALKNEKVTQAATAAPTQEVNATAGQTVLPTGEMETHKEVDVNTRSVSESTDNLSSSSTTNSLASLTTTPAGELITRTNQTEHQNQQSSTSSASRMTPTLAKTSPLTVTQLENTLSPTTASILKSTETTNTSESVTTSSLLELSPSSQNDFSISTSQTAEMTDSSSTSTESPTSTTSFSIFIPGDGKKIPKSVTPKAPREVSQSPSVTNEVQSCSTYGVVKQCLIIIACLAAVATIFVITTIALCMKLSSRKYRVKKSQQGTEMICISSLLPERNYTYSRQRNPVSNGVLVLPGMGDSEEDIADNLTLSSFLPDNDRYV